MSGTSSPQAAPRLIIAIARARPSAASAQLMLSRSASALWRVTDLFQRAALSARLVGRESRRGRSAPREAEPRASSVARTRHYGGTGSATSASRDRTPSDRSPAGHSVATRFELGAAGEGAPPRSAACSTQHGRLRLLGSVPPARRRAAAAGPRDLCHGFQRQRVRGLWTGAVRHTPVARRSVSAGTRITGGQHRRGRRGRAQPAHGLQQHRRATHVGARDEQDAPAVAELEVQWHDVRNRLA